MTVRQIYHHIGFALLAFWSAVIAVKYLWWLCRYGYWNNPYEVEARVAANKHK